jgi:hypothetical protein
VNFETMGQYRIAHSGPPTLMLGYAQIPDAAIPKGIAEVAAAVRAGARAAA